MLHWAVVVALDLSPCGQPLTGGVWLSPTQPPSSSPYPLAFSLFHTVPLPPSPTTLHLCPFLHQSPKTTILHIYKCLFLRLGLWQQVSLRGSGRQTVASQSPVVNHLFWPPVPRQPVHAARSPCPAARALPGAARAAACREPGLPAPFQRTPGYGGEQHAASESSRSLGKSLRGSSPAACLPETGGLDHAAGTLPPCHARYHLCSGQAQARTLPGAATGAGWAGDRGIWDGL